MQSTKRQNHSAETRMQHVRVVTEYSCGGKRGGYRLQWIGIDNKPSWVVGTQRTFGWFKYKKDAIKSAEVYNRFYSRSNQS